MKRLKYILPFGILLVCILIAVVIIKSKKEIVQEAPPVIPPQVRVMKAQKQELQMIVRSQGTVRAKTESEVVAQEFRRKIGDFKRQVGEKGVGDRFEYCQNWNPDAQTDHTHDGELQQLAQDRLRARVWVSPIPIPEEVAYYRTDERDRTCQNQ